MTAPLKLLIGGAIIGAFNGIYSLFPNVLTTGVAILSLGLIPLIGAIIVFGLAAWLVEGFRLKWGIWSAIMGAIFLAIVSFYSQLHSRTRFLVKPNPMAKA